jgi:hypothetical protein
VLTNDLEAGPERRVDAVLHDRLQRRHRRVDHHLVAGRDVSHILPHRVDDPGDVAAGHVRQRGPGHPPRQPQVHMVQGRRSGPDPHIARSDDGIVDGAEPVAAGRLVENPGPHGRRT